MLHVPDVDATADWYASIGFTILTKADDGDETTWASLAFGETRVMLSVGGTAGTGKRRDADLYLTVDDVEERYQDLRARVEVIEPIYDAFYGMREFIIRDINGFWITFGQPIT